MNNQSDFHLLRFEACGQQSIRKLCEHVRMRLGWWKLTWLPLSHRFLHFLAITDLKFHYVWHFISSSTEFQKPTTWQHQSDSLCRTFKEIWAHLAYLIDFAQISTLFRFSCNPLANSLSVRSKIMPVWISSSCFFCCTGILLFNCHLHMCTLDLKMQMLCQNMWETCSEIPDQGQLFATLVFEYFCLAYFVFSSLTHWIWRIWSWIVVSQARPVVFTTYFWYFNKHVQRIAYFTMKRPRLRTQMTNHRLALSPLTNVQVYLLYLPLFKQNLE